jgi:hypothetical protein
VTGGPNERAGAARSGKSAAGRPYIQGQRGLKLGPPARLEIRQKRFSRDEG